MLKVGDKVVSKNDYIGEKLLYLGKNKIYTISKIHNFYDGEVYLISVEELPQIPTCLNIKYFYTTSEIRKQKLNKICSK